MWATEDTPVIQPKTEGAGIMISDFVDQHRGYLRLTDSEHALVTANDPKTARALLEYGAEKEGYWTGEKFMENVKDAVRIADYIIYPSDAYTVVWVFDQSSCHRAFAEDALNVRQMNVQPGGAQPAMRIRCGEGGFDGGWDMRMVLEERGISMRSMNGDNIRVTTKILEMRKRTFP